jgi:hypothetical protein
MAEQHAKVMPNSLAFRPPRLEGRRSSLIGK